MNDFIKQIHQRRSIGKLSLPMPTADELTLAIHCAMSAPDHKQLTPWQFVVMTGNALDDFGQVLLQAGIAKAEQTGETLDDAGRTKLINMPKRAPMIIMLATDIKQHDKVPPFEQLLSAGAAAQNLLLAFESMGYHSVWRTGPLCNEPALKAYFGVADKDTICGLMYIGSSDVVMPKRDLSDVASFVRYFE
ncbi:MAG: nitroreductase [Moraxella sp.]|nr:nitroreductase [Moraxella sp.]